MKMLSFTVAALVRARTIRNLTIAAAALLLALPALGQSGDGFQDRFPSAIHPSASSVAEIASWPGVTVWPEYGTNLILSPTNGPLQIYAPTNAATITLAAYDTNNFERIRLAVRGSNTVAFATGNLSNATALTFSSDYGATWLFDKGPATNLWHGYKLR